MQIFLKKNNGIRNVWFSLLVLLLSVLVTFSVQANRSDAPEFTHTQEEDWINSEPLKLKDLRGEVVLIDFWSFGCWNCYRSFPWLHELEAQFKDDSFTVIGVHTPEFDHEKIRENIVAKVKEFKLEHPVMIDNDFSYWNAMRNRYWPTFYLIDKDGRIQGKYIGETHAGRGNALKIEAKIEELLSL